MANFINGPAMRGRATEEKRKKRKSPKRPTKYKSLKDAKSLQSGVTYTLKGGGKGRAAGTGHGR